LAASDIRKLVEEKADAADRQDWFALLGIGHQASKPEVQKAYFDLAKVLHPDKLSKQDLGDLRERGARLFKDLSEAYNTLMDAARREAYMKTVPPAPPPSAGSRTTQELVRAEVDPARDEAAAKEAAKIFYHRGMMMMKKGGYEEAQTYLVRALASDADNPRYELQLGWAIFQNEKIPERRRLTESKVHLESALRTDGENPQAHYYMARWCKARGETDRCRQHLERALDLRGNYIEVQRELRLLDMREGKAPTPAPSKAAPKKGSPPPDPGGSRWPFGLDKLFKKGNAKGKRG